MPTSSTSPTLISIQTQIDQSNTVKNDQGVKI